MFTIGADPEFFLRNNDGLVSAIGKIGGSKQLPREISPVGHAVLEDNVAVEFNIPPSTSSREFIENLNFVLSYLRKNIGNLSFAEGVASASFPEDELNCPEAFIFGCEPDFNAWTGRKNKSPRADDFTLRSAGGHVHVGTDLDKIQVIRAMDLYLGVPSVLLDTDTRRRQLYGKPGAFRPKEYGVEYRTLSNFWIWKDSLKEWVFRQTEKALDFVASGKEISSQSGIDIRRAINTGNANLVKSLHAYYGGVIV